MTLTLARQGALFCLLTYAWQTVSRTCSGESCTCHHVIIHHITSTIRSGCIQESKASNESMNRIPDQPQFNGQQSMTLMTQRQTSESIQLRPAFCTCVAQDWNQNAVELVLCWTGEAAACPRPGSPNLRSQNCTPWSMVHGQGNSMQHTEATTKRPNA